MYANYITMLIYFTKDTVPECRCTKIVLNKPAERIIKFKVLKDKV